MGRRRRIRDYALTLFNKFNNDTTMSLVAMVSFNVLTSVVPLILALITAVALLPVVSHNVPELAAQINRILPADLQKDANIARLLTSIHSASKVLTLVSIVGLLWGGMNLFSSIECAFAFIFRVKTRDLVPQKLMSLVMILLFVVLLPLSFVASIVLGTATTRLGSILPSALSGPYTTALGVLTALVALFVLVRRHLHYRAQPSYRLAKHVARGVVQCHGDDRGQHRLPRLCRALRGYARVQHGGDRYRDHHHHLVLALLPDPAAWSANQRDQYGPGTLEA